MTVRSAYACEARTSPAPDDADLLALAPLGLDARALRAGAPSARVMLTGVGPRRARVAAARARAVDARAVAILGAGGAVDPSLEPGELVVATEVRHPGGSVPCPAAGIVAGTLRRAGLSVRLGPIVSHPHGLLRSERARLRASGALAADTESAWLAEAAGERPLCVLRAIVRSRHPSVGWPLGTVASGARANPVFEKVFGGLGGGAAVGCPRRVLLAAPRASCAGVERAVDIVGRELEGGEAPLYVRKQIVHNAHVVGELERRGAVFVDEVDDVPEGAEVVFSAHGVAPAVRRAARERRLRVVDATCPLVAKVHAEARRFAAAGYTVVLIGHAGHEEVEGTLGEAPECFRLVGSLEEAEQVEVPNPERVAYLTQTTLAVDETSEIVEALERRFPALVGPPSDDICYATQNRQDAVRLVARQSDLVLVVGSRNSSNSTRLMEVARREGARAHLIDDETDIELEWLDGVDTVGLTAGASAPESMVQQVLRALDGVGDVSAAERAVTRESVHFKLPPLAPRAG